MGFGGNYFQMHTDDTFEAQSDTAPRIAQIDYLSVLDLWYPGSDVTTQIFHGDDLTGINLDQCQS